MTQNLVDAEKLYSQGKYLESEKLCKELLNIDPSSGVLLVFAKSLHKRGLYDQALAILDLANKAGASQEDILLEKAYIYRTLVEIAGIEYHESYLGTLNELLKEAPNHQHAKALLAEFYETAYQAEKTKTLLQENLDYHKTETTFNNYATYLQNIGKMEESCEYFRKALELSPNSALVNLNLAQSDKDFATIENVKKLQKLLKTCDYSNFQKGQMNFAIAKIFDVLKKYDRAMEHFNEANANINKVIGMDINELELAFEDTKNTFTQEWLDKNAIHAEDVNSENPVPIFILGMPRSGSTLIEQIIATHDEVRGLGEINSLKQAFAHLFADLNYQVSGRFEKFRDLSKEDIKRIRENYFAEIKFMLGDKKPKYTIDKMLTNFFFIPLIRAAFPEAIIINSQRNPLDTCMSIYKILFVGEFNHCYNQKTLAKYYLLYKDLMDHYSKMPDLNFYIAKYENIISDQEYYSKEILDHCQMNWDDKCLEFYKHKKEVKTASYAQVRKPIYKSSMQSWKKYERHIRDMVKILEDIE